MKAQPSIAVFGGSFNPVHEGHLGIVRALADDAELQAVIVVPARCSPYKQAVPPLPDAVRWNMLRHAMQGLRGVMLSDVELTRPAPSYTIDTLRALASQLPAARLLLALGWDTFAEFAGWHRAAEILSLAGLIVFDRAHLDRGEPAAIPPSADWARLLPPPWDAQARPRDGRHLELPDGRVLLRHLPTALPSVAARDILLRHSLEDVPAGAREVLAAYWGRASAD